MVEGKADRAPYIDPLVVWHPADASPSGLAIVNDVAYVACLRGARLWQVPLVGGQRGEAKALLVDRYGRLRSLAVTDTATSGSPPATATGAAARPSTTTESCCCGCAEPPDAG